MSFFSKIGHGLKVVVVDTGKAAEAVGKQSLKVVEVVAPVALPEVLTMTPAAPAVPLLEKLFSQFQSKESLTVNPLETMGVTIAMGVLVQSIHNPQHAALMKDQMLGIAAIIFRAYGLTPPAPAQ